MILSRETCAFLTLLVASVSFCQTPPNVAPNSFTGVVSSQNGNPSSVVISQVGCSTGSTSWSYTVTANDAAGGSSQGTASNTILSWFNSRCFTRQPDFNNGAVRGGNLQHLQHDSLARIGRDRPLRRRTDHMVQRQWSYSHCER